MHRLTVEQAMSAFSIVQQPAFCIRKNGTLAFNPSAKYLIPSCAAALPQWLGSGKVAYDNWDKAGALHMTVQVHNTEYSLTVQPLVDGTLFLMTPIEEPTEADRALAVVSQVLRQPLTDMSMLLHQKNDDEGNAALYRQLYRMTRIVANLTDMARLSTNTPLLHTKGMHSDQLLADLTEEVSQLCNALGREFIYLPSKKECTFYIDANLVKRALLNLISNALKFSPKGTPVTLRTEVIGTHFVLQVENTCTDKGSELLRAAFSRISQRGFLPDPIWGVGLGLPLANTIARLHGGMVAVETLDGKATVSLSISLRAKEGILGNSLQVDYSGGMRQSLLELSDVLPDEVFHQ